MAFIAEVSFDEPTTSLKPLDFDDSQSLKARTGGIEDANDFVDAGPVECLLTLLECPTVEPSPIFLQRMRHLARCGIPLPEDVAADAQGGALHPLKGRPAAIVNGVCGASELTLTAAHCGTVGEALANVHLACIGYTLRQPNPRGLPWWNESVPIILPRVSVDQRALLQSELTFQHRIAASVAYRSLPRIPLHADFLRDNVRREDDCLSRLFDFFFVGWDTFLFDIGVCLNGWCIDQDTGCQNITRAAAFLAAYQSVRRLEPQEHRLLPALRRAAALRFWLSRRCDFSPPCEAAVLRAHDPSHFERVLRKQRKDHC